MQEEERAKYNSLKSFMLFFTFYHLKFLSKI